MNDKLNFRLIAGIILMAVLLVACAGPGVLPASPTATVPATTVEQPTLPVTVAPSPAAPTLAPSPANPGLTPDPNQVTVSPAQPEPGSPDRNAENPYRPAKGDESMKRGNVFIEDMGIVAMESFPVQYQLSLSGNLPTPCHELRVVIGEPDANNQIQIEAYTVYDPGVMCTQVLKPFSADIPLGTFPNGKYTVLVNGEQIGEVGQ